MNDVLTYDEWLEGVDLILVKTVGLDQMAMSDWLSRDAYESGLTTLEGARECLIEQEMMSEEEIDNLLGG